MRQKKLWFATSGILAVLAMALMVPVGTAAAKKYKVLYKFTGGMDGASPFGPVIWDESGNLYGTTWSGGSGNGCGTSGCGTVFKLTPSSDGTWTESVLYSFCSLTNCADGSNPLAGLIFDRAGNLYGTAEMGSPNDGCGGWGCGAVFKLTPGAHGSWAESVLYSFSGPADRGQLPWAGLVMDAAGSLYGTTVGGGTGTQCNYYNGCGTVFKLTQGSDGSWTQSVLYSFTGVPDGAGPFAPLIWDTSGNLYGTTFFGGANYSGAVFKLTPHSDETWTESVLYNFASDGEAGPMAPLGLDSSGNLYGTSYGEGASGNGTVFKLTPGSNGRWTESVLHSFGPRAPGHPEAGLIFDTNGSLWGTAYYGGAAKGGAVFKLTPKSGESWSYSTPHVFHGKPATNPHASVIFDKAGNLYGTTAYCGSGTKCQGVVFEITP